MTDAPYDITESTECKSSDSDGVIDDETKMIALLSDQEIDALIDHFFKTKYGW